MAIVFEKQLSLTDLLFSYNNNTVTFKQSSNTLIATKATVFFNNMQFTLFPDPQKKFYFNFKYAISTMLNGTNNFSDVVNFDLVSQIVNNFQSEVIADGGTFEAFDCLVDQITDLGVDPIIDYTDTIFGNFCVTYNIFYSNNTNDTSTICYNFLSAYVNPQNYKQLYPGFPYAVDTQMMLKPIPYLKYWSGYPFDLTFYNGELSYLEIATEFNDEIYTNENRINRVVISNGNELINLERGYNNFVINNVSIQIEKITDVCEGHYLKWLNAFGGWNYWLFYKGNDTLTTKDLGTIYNDYEDVLDTISPYVAIGKTSENNIVVQQELITPNEMLILNDLLESPKVYLFTGTQNEIVQPNDWLEVTIKAGSFRVVNSREKLNSLSLTIELPANNTKTL